MWDWEKLRMERNKGGRILSFHPYYGIYDQVTGRLMVFAWTSLGSECPFLDEAVCKIYEDRPLYCRAFPLGYSPADKKLITGGECSNNDIETRVTERFGRLENLDVDLLSEDKDFHQLYLNAKSASEIPYLITALLNRLEENGIIIRDISLPIENMRRSIADKNYTSFFDHLISIGVLPEDEYEVMFDYFLE
jgi:Fe-S-cluster containining protein